MAIATMQLRLYVTAVSGGGVFYQLQWTQGSDNWGTAVNATQADFESTGQITQGSPVDATAVGYIYFDLDPADFDFGLTLYWRLVDTGYNDPDVKNSFIATQNHATTAWRPVLIITEAIPPADDPLIQSPTTPMGIKMLGGLI